MGLTWPQSPLDVSSTRIEISRSTLFTRPVPRKGATHIKYEVKFMHDCTIERIVYDESEPYQDSATDRTSRDCPKSRRDSRYSTIAIASTMKRHQCHPDPRTHIEFGIALLCLWFVISGILVTVVLPLIFTIVQHLIHIRLARNIMFAGFEVDGGYEAVILSR